jgi:hypothetical protein
VMLRSERFECRRAVVATARYRANSRESLTKDGTCEGIRCSR